MQANSAFVNLLETNAKQRNATVGRAFQSHIRATQSVGLTIGGIAETQDMLDFCVKHNFTADVDVIPIQKINEASERLLKSDVKYRFSIDMASMKLEEQAGMTTMRPRH